MAYAPTEFILGTQPSFRLLSNFCISSALLTAAIAALTFAFSSSVIKRPALPDKVDGSFGSSECADGFVVLTVTVLAIVLASAFGTPSGVTNSDFARLRSYA